MLVISNGAFKSGSTWLFNIIYELTKYPPPQKKYLDPEHLHPSLVPSKLQNFLIEEDFNSSDFLVKNHFKRIKQREQLLSYPEIRIINIKRNIPDVIVSAYFHHRLKYNFKHSFQNFYYSRGRFITNRIVEYHKLWDFSSPQIFVCSYECLISSFNSEVRKLSLFLKQDPSDKNLKLIYEVTRIENLREKYEDIGGQREFFRKGIVGDWKKYFSNRMIRDINNIIDNGLSSFDQSVSGKIYYRWFVPHFLERRYDSDIIGK